MKNSLKNRFLEFAVKNSLFKDGEQVLVAVSGGVDSMVLLNLLQSVKQRFGIELGIVHLNHRIRGEQAEQDLKFVEDYSHVSNLPFHGLREDVPGYADKNNLSLEAAGHILREEAFEKLAGQYNYQKIATAHHLDDQAETVLMRLISGSGLQGLAGIRLKRGKWVRPLLFARRCEIEKFAEAKKIPFRTDMSNRDTRFLRNKIRHNLLPLLKREFDPNVTHHLSHFSTILKEWDVYLENELKKNIQNGDLQISKNKIALELNNFSIYFSWIKFRMVEYVLSSLQALPFKIQFGQFSDFCDWSERGKIGSLFTWGNGLICVKERTRLVFFREKEGEQGDLEVEVFPGRVCWIPEVEKGLILTEIGKEEAEFSPDPLVEYLDGSRLKFPLLVRRWRAGDRFQPLGMKKEKLVSDFLTDKKIGSFERRKALLLLNGEEPVSVLGIQISDNYKIQSTAGRVFKLTVFLEKP